ncbi:MAG: 30S ribosomal protein S20 [Acidimicrobiia bacterium]|nr:30S ribosomal protein S20 [Acidimicrobiia bacterium]
MANIQSQKKRNRQTEKRHARNKSIRSELKTREKNVMAAVEAGNAVEAEELLRIAQKQIDMAITKGVIHANTAARRKSRLTHRVRSILV